MTITSDQLPEILRLHAAWLRDEPGGVRANLDGANLDGASLNGASLIGASLAGASLIGASLTRASLNGASLAGASLDRANLTDASLIGANLIGASLTSKTDIFQSMASVSFTGHGECGRTLMAIRGTESLTLRCGCFSGTVDDLRAYIANGPAHWRKTRTLALDTVMVLLDAQNADKP